MYDYLVVGAGLYGAIFAHEAKVAAKSVLVIDKRSNIAGNVFTEKVEGINVHKYGAHIFLLLFFNLRSCFLRCHHTPHLVEGIHIKRHGIKLTLIIRHR